MTEQESRPLVDPSDLRKRDETLLDITEDGTYDELYSEYFGDTNPA